MYRSYNGSRKPISSRNHLTYFATTCKPIKRVKPDPTPGRPKIEGANNRDTVKNVPTVIYIPLWNVKALYTHTPIYIYGSVS